MRIMPVVAIAFALGFTLLAFNMVGAGSIFETDRGTTAIEGEVEEQTERAQEETVDPEEDTGFFSYIGSGLSTFRQILTVLAYLPSALESVGFPDTAAWLVGRSVQIGAVLGVLQIALQWEVR